MMMLRGKTDPKTGKHTFVQACAVERHMDISQEPFCTEICRKNAGRKSLGHRVVRACAVETHMDISQKPLSVTVRTPSVWPHCLGKNVKKDVLPRSQSLFRRGLQSTAPTKNEPEAHDQLPILIAEYQLQTTDQTHPTFCRATASSHQIVQNSPGISQYHGYHFGPFCGCV